MRIDLGEASGARDQGHKGQQSASRVDVIPRNLSGLGWISLVGCDYIGIQRKKEKKKNEALSEAKNKQSKLKLHRSAIGGKRVIFLQQ